MTKPRKRKGKRYSLSFPMKLSVTGGSKKVKEHKVLTENVSSGGAFVNTKKPLPIGSEVDIEMIIPLERLRKIEGKKVSVRVSGVVVRSGKSGMAINFDETYEILPCKK